MPNRKTPPNLDKASELTDRSPTIDDVLRGFRFRHSEFEYILLSEAELLHTIAVCEGWLMVIGHPEDGGYEWVYVECSGTSYIGPRGWEPRAESDEVWKHSNCGHGGIANALLAGLLATEGPSCTKCGCWCLPEDAVILCHHCRTESE